MQCCAILKYVLHGDTHAEQIYKLHRHTNFRLIPTSMTLSSVIALILLFSPHSIAVLAKYATVVKDRPITSEKYCLPVTVFHFRP